MQVRRTGLHGAPRQLLQRRLELARYQFDNILDIRYCIVINNHQARHQVQRQEAHRVRGDDDVDGDGGDLDDDDDDHIGEDDVDGDGGDFDDDDDDHNGEGA